MTEERGGEGMEEVRLGPERATFIVRLARARHLRSEWRGQVEYVKRGERIDEVDIRPRRVRISGVSSREGGPAVVAEATARPEVEAEGAFEIAPTPTVAPARQIPPAPGAWAYLALEDSLAAGTGASAPSERYTDRFQAYPEARWGTNVPYDNHARPGENAPSFPQAGQADLALASIAALRDDGDPATQVKVVTFQVGANDIFGFFLDDTCRSDPQGAACEAQVDGALSEFGSNYRTAVRRLVDTLDEGALLVLLDYYNPFNLGTGLPLEAVSEEKIVALNAQIHAVAGELGLPVVPVHGAFGDAGGALTHILEGDEHPNDDGFAVIFSALVETYVGAGGPEAGGRDATLNHLLAGAAAPGRSAPSAHTEGPRPIT